jgi:hypothetical protein
MWDSGIGLSSWLINLANNGTGCKELPSGAADEDLGPKRYLVHRLNDALFADQPRCIVELGEVATNKSDQLFNLGDQVPERASLRSQSGRCVRL